MQWHRKAACRGSGAAYFVRSRGATYSEDQRAVCRRCPVQQECFDFAMVDESLVGLWAGLDDGERRELRRRVA